MPVALGPHRVAFVEIDHVIRSSSHCPCGGLDNALNGVRLHSDDVIVNRFDRIGLKVLSGVFRSFARLRAIPHGEGGVDMFLVSWPEDDNLTFGGTGGPSIREH